VHAFLEAGNVALRNKLCLCKHPDHINDMEYVNSDPCGHLLEWAIARCQPPAMVVSEGEGKRICGTQAIIFGAPFVRHLNSRATRFFHPETMLTELLTIRHGQ